MRYILVNQNKPPPEPYPCTFCTTNLGNSYVRDLDTRLVYHNPWCLETHIDQSLVCIEDAFRWKEGQ